MNMYLDIAISMILIFLIFSVVVYVLQELLAINLEYRGKMLWKSLAQLLDGFTLPGKRSLNAVIVASKTGNATGKTTNTPITDALFGNAQILTLQKDMKTLPSYIPSSNFALAVIDEVAKNAPTPRTGNLMTDFTAGLKVVTDDLAKAAAGSPPPVIDVLNNLAGIASNIQELQDAIEKWYNDYMNRVSGWYQAHTVFTIRLIALAVTLVFNLNCIQLVNDIAGNSTLRNSLANVAEKVVDHPEAINGFLKQGYKAKLDTIDRLYGPALKATEGTAVQHDSVQRLVDSAKAKTVEQYTAMNIRAIDSLTEILSTVHLPMGWGCDYIHREFRTGNGQYISVGNVLLVLLGWLITAGCLSMGAPFWFNLLIQFVNIRRAGVKPGGDKKK